MEITSEELAEVLKKAVKAGIEEYKRQETKERKKDKYHDTFALMKHYRDAAFHVENAVSEGAQLKPVTKEQKEMHLRSVRRTKFKTMLMLDHIDRAVEELENRRKAAGREVEYKAFEMYFMQGIDYMKIAEELNTGKNTPRRWIAAMIKELSVLLWGLDEEREK